MFKSILNSLVQNRTAEKDIRDWLTKRGYSGNSAKFGEVELHAIGRPGWVQVFRFDVTTMIVAEQNREHLFGAMRDDERYGPPKIVVFKHASERDEQLASWSENLIVHRRWRKSQ